MIKKLVLFAFIFLLVGCNAARKVNLTKQSESINLSENSIVLISLELTRSSPSRFIPLPIIVKLTKINAENKEETINVAVDKDAGEAVNQSGNSFLIRIELPPGHYQLHSVVGRASAFPLNGFFNIPFLLETDLPANSVVYLGKIHANLRPRVGDEFRAGSIAPLIDQAITGISNSGVDIEVIDKYEQDVVVFKNTFPALKSVEIKKQILPSFDRQKAQNWWQGIAPKKE